MNKKLVALLSISALSVFSGSCGVATSAQAPQQGKTQGEYAKDIRARDPDLPKCDQPVGTIVARGLKCKAAACGGERIVYAGNTISISPQQLGEGLSDMIVTALVKTGCFRVLERGALQDIKEELELLGKQPQGSLKGADFIFTGSITALEMNESGMGGGGGLRIPVPFAGSINLEKGRAHIAVDMRIVRVRDGEILVAETVEGKSERWKFGISGGGFFGDLGTDARFDSFKNTPMEEALRDLVYQSVNLIVSRVKNAPPVKTASPANNTSPTNSASPTNNSSPTNSTSPTNSSSPTKSTSPTKKSK